MHERYKRRLTVNLEDDIHDALRRLAATEHTQAGVIVRQLIVRRLREEGLLLPRAHADSRHDE